MKQCPHDEDPPSAAQSFCLPAVMHACPTSAMCELDCAEIKRPSAIDYPRSTPSLCVCLCFMCSSQAVALYLFRVLARVPFLGVFFLVVPPDVGALPSFFGRPRPFFSPSAAAFLGWALGAAPLGRPLGFLASGSSAGFSSAGALRFFGLLVAEALSFLSDSPLTSGVLALLLAPLDFLSSTVSSLVFFTTLLPLCSSSTAGSLGCADFLIVLPRCEVVATSPSDFLSATVPDGLELP